MNKLLIIILVISIIGNGIGLFIFYKYWGAKKAIEYIREDLEKAGKTSDDLANVLDKLYSQKMVFLHHSVGRGLLYEGGLRDSLLDLGILVKGATYGDIIGEQTDIKDWLPKFQNEIDDIFDFKAHPNQQYRGENSNDMVMFKSCFPNSDIASDGDKEGDPFSSERTLQNYKAVFNKLGLEIKKYPDKLFIYLTAPPLVAEATTPENAQRARQFNNWLIDEFLPDYSEGTETNNLVIFDLFNSLAEADNYLKKEYRKAGEGDSHPNELANKKIAQEFMNFFRPIWNEWQINHPKSS